MLASQSRAADPPIDLPTATGVPADPQRQAASYGDPSLSLAPDLAQSLTAFLDRAMQSGGNADPLK